MCRLSFDTKLYNSKYSVTATSPRACDFTKKRLQHRYFKNTLFTEHFRAAASGCCTIVPLFLWCIVLFNCSYLISKVRILYFFVGKFILLICMKMSSLNPFLNPFNTELKTFLSVSFVSAFYSKHSEITKTHAKE